MGTLMSVPEHQFLGEREELRGRGLERQHHLRLGRGHAGDPGNLGDLGGAEQPARGEARAHPHALAGHRDLAEDEAVTALDEARDALGHRPERHQARHAHRDAEHREQVAARQEPPHGDGSGAAPARRSWE